MNKKLHVLCAATIAAGAVFPLNAIAETSQPLPGVEQPAPIVQAPKPEPMAEPGTPDTFKVGNFDVKVSGSITVDVGVNVRKPPR